MMRLANHEDCTGCRACEQVCKHGAITIVKDSFGFGYPSVSSNLCTDCGACSLVCHALVTEPESSIPEDIDKSAYAFQDNDWSKRKAGSSGGFFGYVVEKLVSPSSVVYGAVFSDDQHAVLHRSTRECDVSALKKSKYLESEIGDCYTRIKEDLRNGYYVVFCGTPCQAAGLQSFLRRPYDNLLIIDFFCHGVCSPEVYRTYLSVLEDEYHSRVHTVEFRSKHFGWKTYCMKIKFENGKTYLRTRYADPYLEAMFSNVCLRDSCYECAYNCARRSDITIGDYWGIRNSSEIQDNDTGVSLVIPNTDKGLKLVADVRRRGDCYCFELSSGAAAYASKAHKYHKDSKTSFETKYKLNPGSELFSLTKNGNPIKKAVYALRGHLRGALYRGRMRSKEQ